MPRRFLAAGASVIDSSPTHYAHSAFPEMEEVLRTEAIDFVQLPYNVADREAEKRLVPAAHDTGTAALWCVRSTKVRCCGPSWRATARMGAHRALSFVGLSAVGARIQGFVRQGMTHFCSATQSALAVHAALADA